MTDKEKATPVTEEEKDDIRVTINLDNGDVECKILSIFDCDEQDYIALSPVDDNDNAAADGDVYFYRYYEDEEGIPSIENITDDEEFDAVLDRFDEILDEELFNEMDD